MIDNSQKSKKGAKGVGPYLDLGLRFAVAVLISTGGGYWLDSKLNTIPLFLILGLFIGATSGFLTIYRAVYSEKEKDSDKGEGKS